MSQSKMDRDTQIFLESLAAYLKLLERGEYTRLARAAGLHPSTVGRLHDDNPRHNPKSLTIFPVLKAICGVFPLKFQGKELLSKLAPYGIGKLAAKVADQVKGLTDVGDIKLLFQFLDILKHRTIFTPMQFGLMEGALDILHQQLVKEKGPAAVTELTLEELEQLTLETH